MLELPFPCCISKINKTSERSCEGIFCTLKLRKTNNHKNKTKRGKNKNKIHTNQKRTKEEKEREKRYKSENKNTHFTNYRPKMKNSDLRMQK